MTKRPFINHLNDLSTTEWLKFQKSWFIHNPPPRKKEVLRHPAKFPETLAQQFIEFFTKRGQVVFDPMAGTGSTLIGALRSERNSYGIELNPVYTEIAKNLITNERQKLGIKAGQTIAEVINANATEIETLMPLHHIPTIDYVLTSPPYWDMLHASGASIQKERRASPQLDTVYSNDPLDFGNIRDYDCFLEQLINLYRNLKPFIRYRAYITIIVKNIKKKGKIYPLAWDLANQMSSFYSLKDEKIWVQNNQKLAPFGIGNAWVSNTFHHYCLQFRNEL